MRVGSLGEKETASNEFSDSMRYPSEEMAEKKRKISLCAGKKVLTQKLITAKQISQVWKFPSSADSSFC
jgi:hypothetical protein